MDVCSSYTANDSNTNTSKHINNINEYDEDTAHLAVVGVVGGGGHHYPAEEFVAAQLLLQVVACVE